MEKISMMKNINEEDTQKIKEEEKTNKEEDKHTCTHCITHHSLSSFK